MGSCEGGAALPTGYFSTLAPACSNLRRLPRRESVTLDSHPPPPTLDPSPPPSPYPRRVADAKGRPDLPPLPAPPPLQQSPHPLVGGAVQEHPASPPSPPWPPAASDALLHVCVVRGSPFGQDVHDELDCGDDVTTMERDDERRAATRAAMNGRERAESRGSEDDRSRAPGRGAGGGGGGGGRRRGRRYSFSTRRHRPSGKRPRPARAGSLRCVTTGGCGEVDASACRTLASCGEDPPDPSHPPDPPYPPGGTPSPRSVLCCLPPCGRSERRERMLRWAVRCAVLLVVLLVGSVLASWSLLPLAGDTHPPAPHKITQGWTDTSADTLLMNVRINPVSLEDFKRHSRTAKNPYDVFRIFFNKMDLSDSMIGELLAARSMESLMDNIQKKSLEEDYSEMPYSDHGDYNEELEMAYGHLLEVEDSPLSECKHPRPEIMTVESDLYPERTLVPECTIVHRCRNVSGCCGSPDLECGPKRIRIVQKAFFVLDTVEDGRVQPSDEVVTLMPIVEHVECECRQVKRLPECNQACPFPFTKMRPHARCTCDCPDRPHEEPNLCHHIKNGHRSLEHDDLARIKSGEYLRPECRIGVFNVKTGYCPKVPRDYDFVEKSRRQRQPEEGNAMQKKSRRHRGK